MYFMTEISLFQSGTVAEVLQSTLINIQGDSADIPMDDLAKGKLQILDIVSI